MQGADPVAATIADLARFMHPLQVTAQRDYVSFAVRTPSVKELSPDIGTYHLLCHIWYQPFTYPLSSHSSSISTADTKTRSSSSSCFEDWWVVEHARQVSTKRVENIHSSA